jgi:hypothetical protein
VVKQCGDVGSSGKLEEVVGSCRRMLKVVGGCRKFVVGAGNEDWPT